MEKLVNKQTPHGACKCFCTTCKAFLEVASKKTQKTEALKTNGCYVIEIVVENFGSGEVFGKKKR